MMKMDGFEDAHGSMPRSPSGISECCSDDRLMPRGAQQAGVGRKKAQSCGYFVRS